MDEVLANRIIFITLNEMLPLATARVSMWSLNDKYAHPPFLRFKFRDLPVNDDFYGKLRKTVQQFLGILDWDINLAESSTNYLLLPKIFEKNALDDNFRFIMESFYVEFGQVNYHKIVDSAIADVPDLAVFIKRMMENSL